MTDAIDFDEILEVELQHIARRRARREEKLSVEAGEGEGEERPSAGKKTKVDDLVGLALSRGGIRSTAFCMGAMQALHVRDAMDRFDYLSSVSGGGYAPAALVAWQRDGNSFSFETNGDLRIRPLSVTSATTPAT